jgi:tripartite-type tricarboxylate transporter receptor subunit TctC
MKKISSKRTLRVVAGAMFASATVFLAATPALGQANKPIVMKVAFPAGGPTDTSARRIQAPLQTLLGQAVIVENQPGAGGSIAAVSVKYAPADGGTLLAAAGNDLILAPLAISQARYKAEGFKLLAPLGDSDVVLVTSKKHNFTGIDELIEHSRRDPKAFSIGTWGYGSSTHIVAADFGEKIGVQYLTVPYKGAAPQVQALLSQEIDFAFLSFSGNVAELIRTGKVRVIGVASQKRNPHLPNVPTLNEGKYLKNFVHNIWGGIFVPANVPDAVAIKLNRSITEVTQRDDFKRYLQDTAALPLQPMTLSEAASFYQSELEKVQRIARKINLEPQ